MNATLTALPADVDAIRAVFDAIEGGHEGMFSRAVAANGEDAQGGDAIVSYVSSGRLPRDTPLGDKAAMMAALPAGSGVTEADVDTVMSRLDIDYAEGRRDRLRELETEISTTVSAIQWVQPTGASDAHSKGTIRFHNALLWVSYIDGNGFEPGDAGWRILWGTASDTPQPWVQLFVRGYASGSRVSHNGKNWHTLRDNNTWEPGTFDSGWVKEGAVIGDQWAVDVAYSVGDEVEYEGIRYECIQAHTSIATWIPPNVPALWRVVE